MGYHIMVYVINYRIKCLNKHLIQCLLLTQSYKDYTDVYIELL